MKFKWIAKLGALVLLWTLSWLPTFAQGPYLDAAELEKSLRAISQKYGQLTKLETLCTTAGNKVVWQLTIGKKDNKQRPAIAVVGGVEGSHLLGTALSVRFAEDLLNASNTDSIQAILETTQFYVFPNMSPDASAQYFAALKYERSGNATPTDDDRDGRLDEDGYEDLDGNNWITLMRIEDPTGDWKLHEADPRVMVKADKSKGEKGNYRVLSEGVDNDGDGVYNEDGPGGIRFNKSLTYQHPYFSPGVGELPVSELENRALLDFLFAHKNVVGVFTFGPSDNLTAPLKFNRSGAKKRIVSSMLEKDVALHTSLSEQFLNLTKFKKKQAPVVFAGGFMQWAYFHYVRMSVGSPGYYLPEFTLPKDSTERAAYIENKDKNKEVDYLRWADKEGEDVFVNWKKVTHPDFPNQTVEVGGFKPFIKTNPSKFPEENAKNINRFIVQMAGAKAELQWVNLKVTPISKGLKKVELTLQNEGFLPLTTALGTRSRWMEKAKVSVLLQKNQSILSGNQVELVSNIEGRDSKTFTWLLQGKGTVKIKVEAAQINNKEIEITL